MRLGLRLSVYLLLGAALAGRGQAQFRAGLPPNSAESASVHGTLEGPAGALSGTYTVVLEGAGGTGTQVAGLGGSFSFESVSPGMHQLRVLDGYGNTISEEMVTVAARTGTTFITVKLPSVPTQSAKAGTVSLAELTHKVPGKAQKEFDAAQKAYDKQDWNACLQHFEGALAIDPQFLRARRGTGLVYFKLNQPENVVSAFEEVVKIDPRTPDAYGYLGAGYAAIGKFEEAETAARRALEVNSGDLRSQFILGVSLVRQEKDDTEALGLLRSSAGSFPDARLVRANLLVRKGRIQEARDELETYLPSARPEYRDQIQAWLKKFGSHDQ